MSSPANPADRVWRARLRERLSFTDLSERRALKLSSVLHYVARAHFGAWHKRAGGPDFREPSGLFAPLVYVELASLDVTIDMEVPLLVRGETFLARTVDAHGSTDRLLREGRHQVLTPLSDGTKQLTARTRLINVFTRHDPDPARRRVTVLPPTIGLGDAPTRIGELPALGTLVPHGRPPDFADAATRAWHYGHTDANRHVNAMEYLQAMEGFVADHLHRVGHDLQTLYYSPARIAYRKPCFRGEGYRRVAWFLGEAPLHIAGAFYKEGDSPERPPAVAIELTLAHHLPPE